jgi:hypothetical protein
MVDLIKKFEGAKILSQAKLEKVAGGSAIHCCLKQHEEDAMRKQLDEVAERAMKGAVNIIMEAVVETIGVDGHSWSDRPCQTCLAVSALIGRPYGCYWYQERNRK